MAVRGVGEGPEVEEGGVRVREGRRLGGGAARGNHLHVPRGIGADGEQERLLVVGLFRKNAAEVPG